MAHHNSTPRSVLDAAVSQPQVLSDQRGYSRRERRHGIVAPPGTDKQAAERAHLEARRHGRNVPYVRPTAAEALEKVGVAAKLLRRARRIRGAA